ncbi:40S ribosomal protein S12 [Collichthys lucidus]|uniref:40S ribosomal protein S12 n=1 Tax=Collichthys lucidus TaxID=240159 RepID=A0A4U5VB38_COLLU|nr:40S ribosomal protein S12 [Collichthys lucidus]
MALPVVSMGLPRPWISVSDTEHQINPIKGDDSRKLSEWVSLCKIKRGGQTLQGWPIHSHALCFNTKSRELTSLAEGASRTPGTPAG